MSENIEKLKDEMLKKHREAEKAAYAYCSALPIGKDRDNYFEVYERIRLATAVFSIED